MSYCALIAVAKLPHVEERPLRLAPDRLETLLEKVPPLPQSILSMVLLDGNATKNEHVEDVAISSRAVTILNLLIHNKLGKDTLAEDATLETQEELRKMKAMQVVAKQALPSELEAPPPSEPPPTESQKASDKKTRNWPSHL